MNDPLCPNCTQPISVHALYGAGCCPLVTINDDLRAWIKTSPPTGANALTPKMLQDAWGKAGPWGRFWREAQDIRRL